MKDKLNKPIEWICGHYSWDGLIKLLPVLKDPINVAAVLDELTQRNNSLVYENHDETELRIQLKEEGDGCLLYTSPSPRD